MGESPSRTLGAAILPLVLCQRLKPKTFVRVVVSPTAESFGVSAKLGPGALWGSHPTRFREVLRFQVKVQSSGFRENLFFCFCIFVSPSPATCRLVSISVTDREEFCRTCAIFQFF